MVFFAWLTGQYVKRKAQEGIEKAAYATHETVDRAPADNSKIYAYGGNLGLSALAGLGTYAAHRVHENLGWAGNWLLEPITGRNWYNIVANPYQTSLLLATEAASWYTRRRVNAELRDRNADTGRRLEELEEKRETDLAELQAALTSRTVNRDQFRQLRGEIQNSYRKERYGLLQESEDMPRWYSLYSIAPTVVRTAVSASLALKEWDHINAAFYSFGPNAGISDLYTTLPAAVIGTLATVPLAYISGRDAIRSGRRVAKLFTGRQRPRRERRQDNGPVGPASSVPRSALDHYLGDEDSDTGPARAPDEVIPPR